MKSKNLSKLCFLLLIFILFGCPSDEVKGGMPLPAHLKVIVEIENKTDFQIDYSLKEVRLGASAFEDKIDEIFIDQEHFDRFKNEYSIDVEYLEEYPFKIDMGGLYEDAKTEGSIDGDNSDKLVYYFYQHHHFKSFLIRFNFVDKAGSENQERILAGWPKYYYSKLDNVFEYGFAYNFMNFDKKIKEAEDLRSVTALLYSIDSDDSEGALRFYERFKIYSLKVTINSLDDISVEVMPDTGSEFDAVKGPSHL